MAKPELSPRQVRLLRKEYVSLFQFSHDIGVPSDFRMVNTFAVDDLNDTDEIGRQALEGDYCVPWIHIALKPIRYHPTLHIGSLPFPSRRVCVQSHAYLRVVVTTLTARLPGSGAKSVGLLVTILRGLNLNPKSGVT